MSLTVVANSSQKQNVKKVHIKECHWQSPSQPQFMIWARAVMETVKSPFHSDFWCELIVLCSLRMFANYIRMFASEIDLFRSFVCIRTLAWEPKAPGWNQPIKITWYDQCIYRWLLKRYSVLMIIKANLLKKMKERKQYYMINKT